MTRLPESLAAWGSPGFERVLKRELECLGAGFLPLQQGLRGSSVALDDQLEVMVIGTVGDADRIQAKVGVFYWGLVAGCNCADDPAPVEAQNEYCELLITIDKASAEASAPEVNPASDA
jgi:hypothetical protein